MFYKNHVLWWSYYMCHILKGTYTWTTVHKTVLENATRLYFSTVRVRLFQSFVFFTILQFYNLTIRHNNSRLSKTCHQMSVTSSQSFFHLILFHTWFNSGSCPLLSSGLLDQILMQRRLNWGVKMALWQFIKKYLNDFIDGSGRSSRDCHCTHTGWCARRNTPSRGLLLLCDRLMQRCGVCKSTCASYVPCFGLSKSK